MKELLISDHGILIIYCNNTNKCNNITSNHICCNRVSYFFQFNHKDNKNILASFLFYYKASKTDFTESWRRIPSGKMLGLDLF